MVHTLHFLIMDPWSNTEQPHGEYNWERREKLHLSIPCPPNSSIAVKFTVGTRNDLTSSTSQLPQGLDRKHWKQIHAQPLAPAAAKETRSITELYGHFKHDCFFVGGRTALSVKTKPTVLGHQLTWDSDYYELLLSWVFSLWIPTVVWIPWRRNVLCSFENTKDCTHLKAISPLNC